MNFTDILTRLDIKSGYDGKYMARCPCHDDKQASLSVKLGKDGCILLHCFAGCSVEEIVAKLGLTMRDLFAESNERLPSYDYPRENRGKNHIEAEYPYSDCLKKVKVRKTDGGKYAYWMHKTAGGEWKKGRNGMEPGLYATDALSEDVYLVEGEKDVDTLKSLGYSAATLPDGCNSKWLPAYGEALKGRRVAIIQDHDEPGRAFARRNAEKLRGIAASVKVFDLSAVWREIPEHGDVSDMAAALGVDRTREALAVLEKTVPEWKPEAPDSKTIPESLILQPAFDVEAREPRYLIRPYLPRGMLAIMGGVSGVGKTYLTLSWAAAISNGSRLPFQEWTSSALSAGYVYYFTKENDPNTVIRPRLDILGANLGRVLLQKTGDGAAYKPLTLNDPRLVKAAEVYPPALVIFDPIQSYLGANVGMNKANEVRPILDWLGDYAKRYDCTVLLVSHMSKPGVGNASALDRLLGSSDFRNTARSIVVVGRDPEDAESRVFAHAKNSIGSPGFSQRYHIDSQNGVVYDGLCDLTADDIVKQAEPRNRKAAVTLSSAIEKLNELLGEDGAVPLEQAEALCASGGISQRTLYNARHELALKSVSIGQPPRRKNWWVRPDVDIARFKFEHSPQPKQTTI